MRGGDAFAKIIVYFFVTLACLLPLSWMIYQLIIHGSAWTEFRFDGFRRALLLRTVEYNLSSAFIAVAIAIPAALAIGRGSKVVSRVVTVISVVALLLPSLVYAYGWSQLLRLLGISLIPAENPDIFRCIWTLATWLWPVAALIMGLSLRRMDPQVQQQAMLDGALGRIIARHLMAPAIASLCIIFALALQEFAVYEPTGISVLATEVRMVFDTGAFSSANNPITAFISSGTAMDASQPARCAAALAAGAPMVIVSMVLAWAAFVASRTLANSESIEVSEGRSKFPALPALFLWGLVFLVPLMALILSMKDPFDPLKIWRSFSPQILGSLEIASCSAGLALVLATSCTFARFRVPLLLGLTTFLIGGQLLAIAQIRLYNRPHLNWMYDSLGVVTLTYLSRFGWIAIAAAWATWSRPYVALREMAASDGASKWQVGRYVVLPLAWPILLASSLLVMILSMTEVPATVLLQPQKPQMLVPLLMTWVHMLRYDPMIEASLLMAGSVIILSAIAFILFKIGFRRATLVLAFGLALTIIGCNKSQQPDEIWSETGPGPGQVVYPRGICYSPKDDTFFVVDRMAHVQHWDSRGQFLNDWHMPDFKIGKPTGLSVGPDGNLYIADTHYQRICVYTPDGKLIDKWGSSGKGPGQFVYPTDIAWDNKGHVFVSEYGDNDRIQVFDTSHKFLYQIGKFGTGDGQFERPQSMVIDGDLIYVTDACNHRINVFKTDGTFVRNMGGPGDAPGQYRFPYGLDEDSDGHLIVCEFGNNRLQLIDKETGKGLKIWGHAGRDPGELAYPWGVCVDKHGRTIAVDAGNNRLQVFRF